MYEDAIFNVHGRIKCIFAVRFFVSEIKNPACVAEFGYMIAKLNILRKENA